MGLALMGWLGGGREHQLRTNGRMELQAAKLQKACRRGRFREEQVRVFLDTFNLVKQEPWWVHPCDSQNTRGIVGALCLVLF